MFNRSIVKIIIEETCFFILLKNRHSQPMRKPSLCSSRLIIHPYCSMAVIELLRSNIFIAMRLRSWSIPLAVSRWLSYSIRRYNSLLQLLILWKWPELSVKKATWPAAVSFPTYIRIIFAAAYQAILEIIRDFCEYSIDLEVRYAQDTSYLSMRIRFCTKHGNLSNVHDLPIPILFSKSALTWLNLCSQVLGVIYPTWRFKLLSLCTDGERTMTVSPVSKRILNRRQNKLSCASGLDCFKAYLFA